MTEEDEYAITFFQNNYYPIVAKFVIIQDVNNQSFSTSFFRAEILQDSYSDLALESNHKGLPKDRVFLNYLLMRASHMQITNCETKDLIHKAQN